jgi:hypothetical protein
MSLPRVLSGSPVLRFYQHSGFPARQRHAGRPIEAFRNDIVYLFFNQLPPGCVRLVLPTYSRGALLPNLPFPKTKSDLILHKIFDTLSEILQRFM